ncbi:Crp/Fnr family transcriptional regulator [Quatrionicoccus australiensis]|uniref:Crp/Fnr family transcriptional regulator n=1 Tax=Quatrionicoccus australiensis TaxID=138118 RepID=UPI001CFB0F7A|nr:Crp/Fnr family transcriptional regulator [Quatrionicoccus australiensis]
MAPFISLYACPRLDPQMPDSDGIITHLAALPLFSTLSASELNRIAVSARKIQSLKGEILFHKGDPCHGFYLIVSGKVKLLFNSLGGSEKVIEILMPGQSFGESAMFMDQPYPLSAQALSDASFIYITKASVLQALESNAQLARQLITRLSSSLHQLFQNQEFNGMRSGKQRIVDYILRQMTPAAALSAVPIVILPASKGTIASHLNITAEHFSRILHELVEHELITVYGKKIEILDLAQLRAVLDSQGEREHAQAAPCRLVETTPAAHASRT